MPENNEFWLQNPVARSFLITSRFNDPRSYGKHEGLDLAAIDAQGKPVDVLAAQRGVVVKTAVTSTGYGTYIIVKHEWPDGHTYVTWYGHLSKIGIAVGDFVSIGQKIGVAGSTGLSTGIHLHITLQDIGHGLSGYVYPDVVDPLPYFKDVAPKIKEAMFVSDETVPDGTIFQPNTPFEKAWRLVNSGTVAWGPGCELAFFSGDQMDAPDAVPLPDTQPGKQVVVSVPMVSPATSGQRRGIWKPRDANGQFFEFPVWVDIAVSPSVPVGQDNSKYLADVSIPDGTILKSEQTFLKEWRVQNTGTTTWRSGYSLAFFDDDQMGAPDSVPVPFTRAGEEAVVAVSLKAPATPGTYRSTWRLRNLEGQFFGEILFALIKVEREVTPVLQDELSYVSDVTIEDGTRVQPGQVMEKVWRVRNTGQSTWGLGYKLAFFSDEQMGAPGSVPLPEIGPGETADIGVTLTAPTAPGIYRSTWKPRNDRGEVFDCDLYAEIEVVSSVPPGEQIDDSKFEKDVTIPDGTVIQAGATFLKTWRIRNTGTTTWGPAYELAYYKDVQMTSLDSVSLPVVEPGEVTDVSIELTAPLSPGSYKSTWRIHNLQKQFFGHQFYALIKVPSTATTKMDNRAQFMGHETVPLWTVMKPGEEFEKIWRVRNIGKSTWGEGYTLAYLDGERMGGPDSVSVPITITKQTARLKLPLIAPTQPGYYQGYWKLRDPRGQFFGPRLPVWIRVKD